MSTKKTESKQPLERRKGRPSAPLYGELLVESGWRPTDQKVVASEGWLRAFGLAADRRAREASAEPTTR